MQSSRSRRTRAGAGFVPAPLAILHAAPVGLALAIMTCLLLAGCSPGADYPSLFPAVHDMPPPRSDVPMNPLEVQKATEDLISERDRLNAQKPQNAPGKNATNDKVTGSVTTAKAKTVKGASQHTTAAPPATTASAQGAGMQAAGADPKP